MSVLVVVDGRARRAWPFLPAYAAAGSWWIGAGGEHVRVNADGSADEPLATPRRWSASTDPCNTAWRSAG